MSWPRLGRFRNPLCMNKTREGLQPQQSKWNCLMRAHTPGTYLAYKERFEKPSEGIRNLNKASCCEKNYNPEHPSREQFPFFNLI